MTTKRRVAVITGGAKGLGRQIALSLAEAGFNIVVSYLRSESEARELVQQVEQLRVKALAVQVDVTDSSALEKLVQLTTDRFGSIDVLVNNAGPFFRERRKFAEYSMRDIQYLIQSNFTAVMELDHLVLPFMRRNNWGRIIHFGFAHAGESRAWPHRAVYAAAKVGLVSFTKTLAVEEAESGITVNMICPGDIRGDNKEKKIIDVEHLIDPESPRGRPGTGEDVARIAAFLCKSESDFITGSMINVAGGMDPIRTWPLT
ncbi:MAG: SDR family oxidoreductase [Paenibacillaceae bacterium]